MIAFPKDRIGGVYRGEVVRQFFPAGRAGAWTPGRSYAFGVAEPVEGQSLPRFVQRGRVTVIACGEVLLHEITDWEAREAGFAGRDELWGYWRGRYGMGPGTPEHPTDELVHWIGFTLNVEEPARFLRPKSGYTTEPALAMRDEGEALSAADLERYAEENGKRLAAEWARTDAQRRRLSFEDRLRVLREQAASRNVEWAGLIEREVEAMDRYLRDQEAA